MIMTQEQIHKAWLVSRTRERMEKVYLFKFNILLYQKEDNQEINHQKMEELTT